MDPNREALNHTGMRRAPYPKLGALLSNYGVVQGITDRQIKKIPGFEPCRHLDDLKIFDSIKKFLGGSEKTIQRYPNSDRSLELSSNIWRKSDYERYVLKINEPGRKADIGMAWITRFNRAPNDWHLDHRYIKNTYQGSGLGNTFLQTFEAALESRANEKGCEQVIHANTGQIDVLMWFLKNGFEATDEHSKKLIEQILSSNGPNQYEVVSKPESDLYHYIFKKGEGSKINDMDHWKGTVDHGIRIAVVKKYPPKRPEVQLENALDQFITIFRKKIARAMGLK